MLRGRRFVLAMVAAAALIAGAAVAAAVLSSSTSSSAPTRFSKDLREPSQGEARGGAGSESAAEMAQQDQFNEARVAPGIVAPGGYSAAYGQLQSLGVAGGTWSELTKRPYDADDPDYRDYYSNSSGGSGLVTGRMTGLAADSNGYVYAGGADGGVW